VAYFGNLYSSYQNANDAWAKDKARRDNGFTGDANGASFAEASRQVQYVRNYNPNTDSTSYQWQKDLYHPLPVKFGKNYKVKQQKLFDMAGIPQSERASFIKYMDASNTTSKTYLANQQAQNDYYKGLEKTVWNKSANQSQTPIVPDAPRSLFNRIVSPLMVGNYMSANIANDVLNKHQGWNGVKQGAWQGLQAANPFGQSAPNNQKTYSDVLEGAGWKDSSLGARIGRGTTGLAMDILLDPLTYATFGLGGLIKGSGQAMGKLAENAPKVLKMAQESGIAPELAQKVVKGTVDHSIATNIIKSLPQSAHLSEDEISKHATDFVSEFNRLRGTNRTTSKIGIGIKDSILEPVFKKMGLNGVANSKLAIPGTDKGTQWIGDHIGTGRAYQAIRNTYYGSRVARLFSPKSGVYQFAKNDPSKFFDVIRFMDKTTGRNMDKIAGDKTVRDYAKTTLGMDDHTASELVKVMEDKSLWTTIKRHVKVADMQQAKVVRDGLMKQEMDAKNQLEELDKQRLHLNALHEANRQEIGGSQEALNQAQQEYQDNLSKLNIFHLSSEKDIQKAIGHLQDHSNRLEESLVGAHSPLHPDVVHAPEELVKPTRPYNKKPNQHMPELLPEKPVYPDAPQMRNVGDVNTEFKGKSYGLMKEWAGAGVKGEGGKNFKTYVHTSDMADKVSQLVYGEAGHISPAVYSHNIDEIFNLIRQGGNAEDVKKLIKSKPHFFDGRADDIYPYLAKKYGYHKETEFGGKWENFYTKRIQPLQEKVQNGQKLTTQEYSLFHDLEQARYGRTVDLAKMLKMSKAQLTRYLTDEADKELFDVANQVEKRENKGLTLEQQRQKWIDDFSASGKVPETSAGQAFIDKLEKDGTWTTQGVDKASVNHDLNLTKDDMEMVLSDLVARLAKDKGIELSKFNPTPKELEAIYSQAPHVNDLVQNFFKRPFSELSGKQKEALYSMARRNALSDMLGGAKSQDQMLSKALEKQAKTRAMIQHQEAVKATARNGSSVEFKMNEKGLRNKGKVIAINVEDGVTKYNIQTSKGEVFKDITSDSITKVDKQKPTEILLQDAYKEQAQKEFERAQKAYEDEIARIDKEHTDKTAEVQKRNESVDAFNKEQMDAHEAKKSEAKVHYERAMKDYEERMNNFLSPHGLTYSDLGKQETKLPDHVTVDNSLTNKDGTPRFASTSRDGQIKVRDDVQPEEFMKYIKGDMEGATSAQKKMVFERLAQDGYDEKTFQRMLNNPKKIRDFLLLHEQSHVDNKDMVNYWANGRDLHTPDKVDMEYRATKDALDSLRAQDKYNKLSDVEKATELINARNKTQWEETIRKGDNLANHYFNELDDIQKQLDEHFQQLSDTHALFNDTKQSVYDSFHSYKDDMVKHISDLEKQDHEIVNAMNHGIGMPLRDISNEQIAHVDSQIAQLEEKLKNTPSHVENEAVANATRAKLKMKQEDDLYRLNRELNETTDEAKRALIQQEISKVESREIEGVTWMKKPNSEVKQISKQIEDLKAHKLDLEAQAKTSPVRRTRAELEQQARNAHDALASDEAFMNYLEMNYSHMFPKWDRENGNSLHVGELVLDRKKGIPAKVKELAKTLRDVFHEMGVKEVGIGKLSQEQLDSMTSHYLTHVMNPEFEKLMKDNVLRYDLDSGEVWMEPRFNEKGEVITKEYGFGQTWNPYGQSRQIKNIPLDGKIIADPSIYQVNEFLKPLLEGKNAFSENVADIYMTRALKHNELMYDHAYTSTMMEELGKDVKADFSADKGFKVVMNYGHFQDTLKNLFDVNQELHTLPDFVSEVFQAFGMDKEAFSKIATPMLELTPEQAQRVDSVMERVMGQLKQDFHLKNGVDGKLQHLADKISTLEKPSIKQVNEVIVERANRARMISIAKDQNKMLQLYDKFTHWMKLMETTVMPSFHARNFMSNKYLNWLAVGNDVFDFNLHKMTLSAMKSQDDVRLLRSLPPVVTKSGDVMHWDEIFNLAEAHGVVNEGFFAKDIGAESASKGFLGKLKEVKVPFSDKKVNLDFTDSEGFTPFNVGARVGNKIENYDRLFQFASHLRQGRTAGEARELVNKFLFDYSDLTSFEWNVMKRIMPFYTWIRKNGRLQVSNWMENPEKYALVQKSMNGVNGMTEDDKRVQRQYLAPFARDWMQTPFNYTSTSVDPKTGKETKKTEPILLNPNMPFMDLERLPKPTSLVDTATTMIPQMNPLLKSAIELGTNHNFFFDSPIVTKDKKTGEEQKPIASRLDYLASQTAPYTATKQEFTKSGLDLGLQNINTFTGVKALSYDYDKNKQMTIAKFLGKGSSMMSPDQKMINNVKVKENQIKAIPAKALYNQQMKVQKVTDDYLMGKSVNPKDAGVFAPFVSVMKSVGKNEAENRKWTMGVLSSTALDKYVLGADFTEGKVTKVRDGDTIEVQLKGQKTSVPIRLNLVDTPESVSPSKPVEPFGKVASQYSKNVLSGKDVRLVISKDKDIHGRYVAYVYHDNQDYQAELLKQGFAKMRYMKLSGNPYRQGEYTKVEKAASDKQNGLWNLDGYTTPNTDKDYNLMDGQVQADYDWQMANNPRFKAYQKILGSHK
jgi:endonuclease YncB( thermonuclease family)